MISQHSYDIGVTMTADTAALEKSIAILQRARDVAAQANQDTSLYDAAIAKNKSTLDAANKVVEESGKGAEKSALSHRELHQSLRLAGMAAGGALGPFGELAHFLSNPYILAVSGAMIAIKMLTDAHEKNIEAQSAQIVKSAELRDMFEGNLRAAILQVNESLAEFHDKLSRAGQSQDLIATRLRESTQLYNDAATSCISLAKAEQALQDQRIQHGLITGATTGPEGHAMEEANRKKTRAAEESAEHDKATTEIAAKRSAALQYGEESRAAKVESDKAIAEKGPLGAALKDAQDLRSNATKELPQLEAAFAKAQAETGFTKPEQAAAAQKQWEAMRKHIADMESQGLNPDIISGAHDEAAALKKRIDKYNAAAAPYNQTQAVIADEDKKIAELTVSMGKLDAVISQLTSRAENYAEKYETLRRAASDDESALAAKERGQSDVDRTNDETERLKRLNELETKKRAGKLTPDEAAEYEGANTQDVGAAITKTEKAIQAINTNVAYKERGHASAAEVTQLHLLLDRLLGLTENLHNLSENQQHRVSTAEQRISNLESTALVNRNSS